MGTAPTPRVLDQSGRNVMLGLPRNGLSELNGDDRARVAHGQGAKEDVIAIIRTVVTRKA